MVSIALAAMSHSALAADSDIEVLKKQLKALQDTVQTLQSKVEKYEAHDAAPVTPGGEIATRDDVSGVKSDLENFKYQYNRDREYNTAQTARPVALSGLVQARIGNDSLNNANNTLPNSVNSNGRHTSFNNGNAALQFNGLLFKDYEEGRNLAYTLRIAANPSAASGQSLGNGTNNVYVQFANLQYNFLPTLSPEDPRLTLTFGQQLLPFGLDAASPDELKPTISPAQFVGNLFGSAIDIGAILKGEASVAYDYGYSYRAPEWQYYAGFVNGSGPNTSDNNQHKDFFGRVIYTVPAEYGSWLCQLAFGASVYRGVQNTSVTVAGAPTLAGPGTGPKNRYGVDVYYNHNPFGVTYEAVRGIDGRNYGTTVATPNYQEVESEGQTVTVYYNIGDQFLYANSALGTIPVSEGRFDDWWPKSYQPFLRFDHWDPAVNRKHSAVFGWKQDITTVGLNVFFAQTTKFQLTYNIINSQNPALHDNNQLLAQFQFGF